MVSKRRRAARDRRRRPRSRRPSPNSPPIRRCTASSSSSRCPPVSIRSRCWRWCRPRRTSTVSPSGRWAGSCAACPVTCRARRSGVMRLLERYGVATSGKRAVVVGRSTLVGLPQVLLLGRKGIDATVTLAHSRTPDLVAVCREADIIVAAAGQARMITAEHVKPGAAVVDVGVSRYGGGHRRRRRLRRSAGGGRRDHADAGRHRPDDDRLPAREHLVRGADARRRLTAQATSAQLDAGRISW